MAGVPSELGARGDKQDVAKIYGALHSCIAKMPKDQLRRVIHIAVCGQMHGVVFWKHGEAWSRWVGQLSHTEAGLIRDLSQERQGPAGSGHYRQCGVLAVHVARWKM